MLSSELLTFYRQVSQQPLTVVDVETTGHRPPQSRVIEVSVLQASLAKGIQQQATYLVNPGIPVPASITRFTGISQAMVDSAPAADQVWPVCLPLLETGVLTAHNLAFDYSFLQAEFEQQGIAYHRPAQAQLCTVMLARLMLSELPSRRLPDLVEHFQFPVGCSHRAEADTMACWLLAEKLLREIQQESDEQVLSRFARQWIPLQTAAQILGLSGKQTRLVLEQAEIHCRLSRASQTPVYQRGDVEEIYWQRRGGRQLSWF
jgi:DNA polymerase III subunit epsilon